MYDFKSLSVRASDEDLRRWKSEAVASGKKFGDWLREAIESHAANSERQINQSNVAKISRQ